MKHADILAMPFVSAGDPRATASGSIDPLGALRPCTATEQVMVARWKESTEGRI